MADGEQGAPGAPGAPGGAPAATEAKRKRGKNLALKACKYITENPCPPSLRKNSAEWVQFFKDAAATLNKEGIHYEGDGEYWARLSKYIPDRNKAFKLGGDAASGQGNADGGDGGGAASEGMDVDPLSAAPPAPHEVGGSVQKAAAPPSVDGAGAALTPAHGAGPAAAADAGQLTPLPAGGNAMLISAAPSTGGGRAALTPAHGAGAAPAGVGDTHVASLGGADEGGPSDPLRGAPAGSAAGSLPACPPGSLVTFNTGNQVAHVLELLEGETRTTEDGIKLNALHTRHKTTYGTPRFTGRVLSMDHLKEVCSDLTEMGYLCTNKQGNKPDWKYRLTATYSDFQVSQGRAAVQPPEGAPLQGGGAPKEDEVAQAAALLQKSRMRALENAYTAAQASRAVAMAQLRTATMFKHARDEAVATYGLSPRGAAAEVVRALMARLAQRASTLVGAVKDKDLVKLGAADLFARPRKRTGSYRVAHQNMGCCYGTNGGAALFPEKLAHLLTLMSYYDVDLVVCTEMPSGARDALQRALSATPRWHFKVTEEAISWDGAKFPEHVAWLYRHDRVIAQGEPACVSVAEWEMPSRVPAYLDLLLGAVSEGTTKLRLYGVHLRPDEQGAREDVGGLATYAGTHLAAPPGLAPRCVFAGDFNLAPAIDLKPNPKLKSGTNAFAELNTVGWKATNFLRTNLMSLAAKSQAGDKDPGGQCRDNFAVHRTLWDSTTHTASIILEKITKGNHDDQHAFVVQLDELLRAQARTMDIPDEWLVSGLTSAGADEPLEWLASLLDGSADGAGPSTDAGGASGARRGSAAHGVCQLGLFDHCFSFIDLSILHPDDVA